MTWRDGFFLAAGFGLGAVCALFLVAWTERRLRRDTFPHKPPEDAE